MGDFNINLLNCDSSSDTSLFINDMCSNALFPFITQPTRVTSKSKTLIDNIFMNFHSQDIISGNLTISISDHMAQFIQFPNRSQRETTISKTFKRCYKNFNNDDFIKDVEKIEWSNTIKDNDNPNDSIAKFLQIFDCILNKHAPLKALSKKETKSSNKPWITKGILTSIKIKDKLYKRYLKSSSSPAKDIIFEKFKTYRNKISNLLNIAKKSHYTHFFQSNLNDVKNTWKGIKELINLRYHIGFKLLCISLLFMVLTIFFYLIFVESFNK